MTLSSRLFPVQVLCLALALCCAPACSQDDGREAGGQGRPRASAEASAVRKLEYRELLDLIEGSKGKVVLVNFWATWCPPCRQELPELVALRQRYAEDQLVVLGVSVDDSTGHVEQFLRNMPLNFPVYWRTPELLAAYQVSGVPYTVVYDGRGRMVDEMVGYVPGKVEAMVLPLVPKTQEK